MFHFYKIHTVSVLYPLQKKKKKKGKVLISDTLNIIPY